MVVTSKWKCGECGSICQKKPAFKILQDSPRRKIDYTYKDMFNGEEHTITQTAVDGLCTTCHHLASHHEFTFEKPGL